MDAHLSQLLATQHDCVARWQLLAAGWDARDVEWRRAAARWRTVHTGVYAATRAPLTDLQRWMAATLTSPNSVLSHASAAARHGFREHRGAYEVITRPGARGRQRLGGVLVQYSKDVAEWTTAAGAIPITTPERTLIDLAPHLDHKQLARATREAIRRRLITAETLQGALAAHRGRRGTAALGALAAHYATLPINRTRSDAEALALERLAHSSLSPGDVNRRINGEEADLVWPEQRLIIEIDGPGYHPDPAEDARKQAAWTEAGYRVRRLSSDAVYEDRG
jgi:very-short-patch-repair endonuclease